MVKLSVNSVNKTVKFLINQNKPDIDSGIYCKYIIIYDDQTDVQVNSTALQVF